MAPTGQRPTPPQRRWLPDPKGILTAAMRAVPSVKYALGVAGVIAAVALVKGFFSSTGAALLAGVGMLVLMVLLLVFAAASKLAPRVLRPPALAMTWAIVVLFFVCSCLSVSSVFFGWPKALPELMAALRGDSLPKPEATKPPMTPELKPSDPSRTVAFFGQEILLEALPAAMRQPIGTTDATGAVQELTRRDSLTLDSTTLIVGKIGANTAASLTVNTLTMLNGSRIVTNGNTFRLEAAHIVVSNGAIVSFRPEDSKQAPSPPLQQGAPGHDAGRVALVAYQGLSGPLRVVLHGQDGGDGGQGPTGDPYTVRAARGNDGVDGLGCLHGGTDGATGANGRQGHQGAPGGTAGNGGILSLAAKIATQQDLITFSAPPGTPGTGGTGGNGGPGQQGGEGGGGSRFCGGGHGGNDGQIGPPGPQGPGGATGTPGKVETAQH